MAYKAERAVEDALEYLGKTSDEVVWINNTDNRGFVISEGNISSEDSVKYVIFIYPICCKANLRQVWLDTRDSGAKARMFAWNYALKNNLKYFCLGVNSEQERYKDYFISLESDEKSISKISYRQSKIADGTGTQVNLPTTFIPDGDYKKVLTPKGFYIAAIKKEKIYEYLRYFDNRPYMDIDYKSNDKEYSPIPRSRNRIISGAPGTGKSYSLEEDRKEYFGRENLYNRVTFHPAYSYAQFFGCFKPISKMKNGEKEIEYSFVPGPFVTTLLKALAEPEKNFLLIIEEINRANVAAVFGDVFQLLDRDDSGKSEYAISISDELMEYINNGFGKELLNDVDVKEQKIRIPANMYIWATMNSADQGVMPMDTAFKRRWDFEYIGIDDGEEFIKDVNVRIQLKDGMQEFNWNELRKQINENLKVHGDEIPEDKLLGPFFIQKYILDMVEQDAGASEAFVKAFKNKVLMYLFDDVARYNLDYVFDTESIPSTAGLSDILAAFDEKGVNIIAGFTADIIPNDEDAEGENLEEEVEPTADGV